MTTKTKRALALIAQAKSRKGIEEALDLSAEERRVLVNNLLKFGFIEAGYVLTEKGRQWLEFVPKTKPKQLAARRAYYYRSKPASAETIVARAKSLPNSVFALGDMA